MRAHQLQGALTGLIMVLLYIIYVLAYSEFQLATVEPKVQTSHSLHKNIVFHQWLVRIIRLDDMTIVFVYCAFQNSCPGSKRHRQWALA